MTIFLIIIIIAFQIVCYGLIAFLVEKFNRNMKEMAEILSQTYLARIDKEIEATKPSEEEAYDPIEVEELSPEEEFALRLNSNNQDSGANSE